MNKAEAKKRSCEITATLIESYLDAEGVWQEWSEQDQGKIVSAFRELQAELEWRGLHRSKR